MFRFKQFAVDDSRCAMKVGTDGVTLGAWASVSGRVLDVGCGCGLIGLMAAQRGAREVVMVEIAHEAALCAQANALASPWADKVMVQCADFLTFEEGNFDSIVSNPPFFATGELAPDPLRASARHEQGLTPGVFMAKAARMLAPAGRVSLILPTDRVATWLAEAHMSGLHLQRRHDLYTRLRAPAPRRVLLEFSAGQCDVPDVQSLNIHSQNYRQLVEPFYL